MSPLARKHDRLAELEWLITHETDRSIRMKNISEYHDLYEELHGPGHHNRVCEGDLSAVRTG